METATARSPRPGSARADGPRAQGHPGTGTVVDGKYRLVRMLGRGGMGTVVQARHVQLGTSFALKFLQRDVLDAESVTERFLREARATAALRSEHVCRVFDVGSFEGQPFLVMELLEGTDLEKVLRLHKRLAPSTACSYLIQACAGLAEAHAAQIVHRDLKPSNLFLMTRADGAPLVKVLDFGIAKAPREAELVLTGTDVVLGSPAYMSLEQLRASKLVDARSDIWSLGVILFELVAGQRPFAGDGVADLALRIAMEPLPRLPDGPAALDAVIRRCVDLDPARRYRDVGELARALAPFADEPERLLARSLGRASSASDVAGSGARSGASRTGSMTTQVAGAIENPRRARRARSRIGLVALAAALASGGISLGVAATRGDGPRSPAQVSQAVEPAPPPPPPSDDATFESAAGRTIALHFDIDPVDAAVEIDGVFVTSRRLRVHRDEALHRVRVTAPGFAEQELELRFDVGQKLSLRLRRDAQAPVRPAKAVTPVARRAPALRIESRSPYE